MEKTYDAIKSTTETGVWFRWTDKRGVHTTLISSTGALALAHLLDEYGYQQKDDENLARLNPSKRA